MIHTNIESDDGRWEVIHDIKSGHVSLMRFEEDSTVPRDTIIMSKVDFISLKIFLSDVGIGKTIRRKNEF